MARLWDEALAKSCGVGRRLGGKQQPETIADGFAITRYFTVLEIEMQNDPGT